MCRTPRLTGAPVRASSSALKEQPPILSAFAAGRAETRKRTAVRLSGRMLRGSRRRSVETPPCRSVRNARNLGSRLRGTVSSVPRILFACTPCGACTVCFRWEQPYSCGAFARRARSTAAETMSPSRRFRSGVDAGTYDDAAAGTLRPAASERSHSGSGRLRFLPSAVGGRTPKMRLRRGGRFRQAPVQTVSTRMSWGSTGSSSTS